MNNDKNNNTDVYKAGSKDNEVDNSNDQKTIQNVNDWKQTNIVSDNDFVNRRFEDRLAMQRILANEYEEDDDELDEEDGQAFSDDIQDEEEEKNSFSLSDTVQKVSDARDTIKKVQDAKKAHDAAKAAKTATTVAKTSTAAATKVKAGAAIAKVGTFVATHWWVILIALGIILALIILFSLISEIAVYEEKEIYIDPIYDYSKTMVRIVDQNGNLLDYVTIDEFAKGWTYIELYDEINDGSLKNPQEVYEAFIILAKSRAMALNNYSHETKEISLSVTGQMSYCDVNEGCDIYEYNGTKVYIPKGSLFPDGNYLGSLPALSLDEITSLNRAASEVKYYILVPKDFQGTLSSLSPNDAPEYTVDCAEISSSYEEGDVCNRKSNIIATVETHGDGMTVFENLWPYNQTHMLYNLTEHADIYIFTDNSLMWWPIGSFTPNEYGIYDGEPTVTRIYAKFGYSNSYFNNSKKHTGIDITPTDGTCAQNIIIAAMDGVVSKVYPPSGSINNCPSKSDNLGSTCGDGGWGNYVQITHDDGTVTMYAHLTSVAVKVGDTVVQGQKIGNMGSSGNSSGCHLHFEVRENGKAVDPENYVDPDNPRPAAYISSSYEEGTDAKQSVCKSLLSSGYSKKATAAIMVNIQAESSFRHNDYGDNGTSYGLCQWHKTRFNDLKNYCGNNYSTIECQLDFLNYELQSYSDVYHYLLSSSDVEKMADYYCKNFEKPANREESCPKRAKQYASSMLAYVQNGCQ